MPDKTHLKRFLGMSPEDQTALLRATDPALREALRIALQNTIQALEARDRECFLAQCTAGNSKVASEKVLH